MQVLGSYKHQVIVGNIGTIYKGGDYAAAKKAYGVAVRESIRNVGRGGNEDVTLMTNGQPEKEHFANKKVETL